MDFASARLRSFSATIMRDRNHSRGSTTVGVIYVAIDENAVEGYLRVFEQVFEKTGQGAHYRMMMREGDGNGDEAPAENATAAALMEQPAG